MSRPGVEIYSSASAPPQGVPTDTSVLFLTGEAQKGPTDAPTRLTSLDDFTRIYGDPIPGVVSYDYLDASFHEGVAVAYFMRLSDGAMGSSADASAIVAGNTLEAASPGVWGDDLTLDVVSTPGQTTSRKARKDDDENGEKAKDKKEKDNGNGEKRSDLLTYSDPEPTAGDPTFMASLMLGGKAVQVSKPMVTRRELADFLKMNTYAVLTGPDTEDPIAAGVVSLAGGADGTVPVVAPEALVSSLDSIPKELGPGNLGAAGKTDFESHAALLAAAEATNRYALLDCDPDDDAVAATSKAAYLRGADQDRYGMIWAPWATIPGRAPGTTRQVPWSAIEAGKIAINDRGGNPNQASAGGWGEATWANGVTMTYTEPEMEAMLYAGVCTARSVYGAVQAYAFRSLVDPAGPRQGWLQANHGRLNMAICAQSEAIGQDHVFSQIDGRGHEIASFGGDLGGMLKAWYDADALFGDTAADAYIVNTGPAVNTIEKLADGVLSAVLSVRMSPHAELVQIYVVKQPITVALV